LTRGNCTSKRKKRLVRGGSGGKRGREKKSSWERGYHSPHFTRLDGKQKGEIEGERELLLHLGKTSREVS